PSDEGAGGINAKQIGLGVSIGSIDTLHTSGSAMTTNNPLDLRIDGDGFFMVTLSEDQEVPFLTRAGDFHLDAARQLVTSDGLRVWSADGAPLEPLDEEVVAFTIAQDGTIMQKMADGEIVAGEAIGVARVVNPEGLEDRKSTRLNSSHVKIS